MLKSLATHGVTPSKWPGLDRPRRAPAIPVPISGADLGLESVAIHLMGPWNKSDVHPHPAGLQKVPLRIPWVGFVVLGRPELHGVHKNGNDEDVRVRLPDPH